MTNLHAYAACQRWDGKTQRFTLKPFPVAWELEPLRLGGPAFEYSSVLAPVHSAVWGQDALAKARERAERSWRMLVGLAGFGVTAEGHDQEVKVDAWLSLGELNTMGSVYALARYLRPNKALHHFLGSQPYRLEIPLKRVEVGRGRACSIYRSCEVCPGNFCWPGGDFRATVGDIAAAEIFLSRCAKGGYGVIISEEPRWELM